MAPPRKRTTAAPGTQTTARQPAAPTGQGKIRVAAFGDSVMWGQGLRREQRFSRLLCTKLKQETGRDAEIVWDMSRSGAEIRATEDQRRQHVDRYIGQFPNFRGLLPFLQANNDSPAAQLYGEVPCTFPTVRGQVRLLPIAEGRTIELALVDGGINDVAPEDIVNPQAFTGEWIEHWDGLLRSVGDEVVGSLINDVRTKCPNALIMYFGFYPTVSYVSNRGKLRELFKYQFDNDFKFWLNKHFTHTVDVNELINEFQTRGEWLAGRWMYWTRQAVVKANRNAAVRGPGVIYVPSGFKPENASLTLTTFLNDDYEPPTSDPARDKRISETPRIDQLDRIKRLMGHAVLSLQGPPFGNLGRGEVDRLGQDLRPRIDGDGPVALISAINELAHVRQVQGSQQDLEDAFERIAEACGNEIKVIQRSMIASLGHPNSAGAASYASHAFARYVGHHRALDRIARERATPPAAGKSLDAVLRRYAMRTNGPLEADINHLYVDSLTLVVRTASNSDRNLRESVWLVVDTKDAADKTEQHKWMLNFRYYPKFGEADPTNKPYPHFEPNAVNRLTVDTAGRINLHHITRTALVMGVDPFDGLPALIVGDAKKRSGLVWRPSTVDLEVNGQRVRSLQLTGQSFKPGQSLDLEYPGPAPLPKVPVLKFIEIAKVRKFGELV